MPKSFKKALIDLHTLHIDVTAGFDVMVDKATPEFRPVARRFRDLHARQARELLPLLPDDATTTGSYMTSVHRAVIFLRNLVGHIDARIMPQIHDGEVWIERAYDDVIEAAPEHLRPDLLSRKAELTSLLRETAPDD